MMCTQDNHAYPKSGYSSDTGMPAGAVPQRTSTRARQPKRRLGEPEEEAAEGVRGSGSRQLTISEALARGAGQLPAAAGSSHRCVEHNHGRVKRTLSSNGNSWRPLTPLKDCNQLTREPTNAHT